ncbi:MAG: hypothetical protein PHH04_03225 [Thomasclavelia sp.]|jgi:hypothetical protein|nr:hypothetical protein [Thomasclavelia sp.]
MKKLISVLMCLFIVFGITGCGSRRSSSSSSSSNSSSEKVTGNKAIISKLEKEKFKFKIELMDTVILTKGDVRFRCECSDRVDNLYAIYYYPNYSESEYEYKTAYRSDKFKSKKISAYLSKYGMSTKDFAKAIASYYKSHFKEITKSKKLSWPSNAITATLPTPTATNGMVTSDSSDSFCFVLFDVSESEYNDYVNQTISKGYNVDYSKYDGYFYSDTSTGGSITIKYDADLKYVTGTVYTDI